MPSASSIKTARYQARARTYQDQVQALKRHIAMAAMLDAESPYRKGLAWLADEALPAELAELAKGVKGGKAKLEKLWEAAKRDAPLGLVRTERRWLVRLVQAQFAGWRMGDDWPGGEERSESGWRGIRQMWLNEEHRCQQALGKIDVLPIEAIMPEEVSSAAEGPDRTKVLSMSEVARKAAA